MLTIRPHKDRVLLELIPEDKKTGGGIFIPDNAKAKYVRMAKVLAISNDCKLHLIPGQSVYAVWNCGVAVEVAGELPNGATNECRLIKSEDILAVGPFHPPINKGK